MTALSHLRLGRLIDSVPTVPMMDSAGVPVISVCAGGRAPA